MNDYIVDKIEPLVGEETKFSPLICEAGHRLNVFRYSATIRTSDFSRFEDFVSLENQPNSPRNVSRRIEMKQYKLESLIYYTKLFADKEHIMDSSSKDIQEKLDEYARKGWRLVSTDATDFGMAVYIYLYFEKDA
ncbi:MAG: hypothetical protein AAGG48_28980 [Planctomycetota bacterium]